MRSPIIAFSIMAAAAVSPVLVGAAPSPVLPIRNTEVQNVRIEHARQLGGLAGLTSPFQSPASGSGGDSEKKKTKKKTAVPTSDDIEKIDSSDLADKEIAKYDPDYVEKPQTAHTSTTTTTTTTAATTNDAATTSSVATTNNAATTKQDFSAPRPGDAVSAPSKRHISSNAGDITQRM